MTMKPFKIQSTSLSLNGVNIDTSLNGHLVIPGVTHASSSIAIEVNDTNDQTATWTGTPVVIDGYTYAVTVDQSIQGQIGWQAAEYAIDGLDGEGFIDGISVTYNGANYTGEAVTYSQTMWAAVEGTSIDPSSQGQWIEIPFSVRCGAGEISSDFGGSGANTGNITFDGTTISTATGDSFIIQSTTENYDYNAIEFNNKNLDLYAYNDDTGSYAELRLENMDNDYPWALINVKANNNNQPNESRWAFAANGELTFPDNSKQTTAYTGQQNGGTPVGPLPSWLETVANTQHLPYINTDYGWDSLGAWTVNATIGDNQPYTGNEGTSYPIRTSFSISNDTKSITTVDFVVSNMGADFGIGVFADGTEPIWMWDGNSGNMDANRIGAQYDGAFPELHGRSGGVGSGYNLPSNGTYRARLTVEPTGGGLYFITLDTLDTSDNLLDSISYTESSFFNGPYRIGFASDQDNGTTKTYFKNLTIDVGNGATIHTDTLTGYNSAISAGANVLVNGNEVLTLETDGSVSFPDGTVQHTAYPGYAPESPTLVNHTNERMSNGTQTGITFTADPYTVIVVASGNETSNSTPALITGITGMGLTWTKRSEYTDSSSNVSQRSEMWYAINNSNSAITDTITITFDNNVDDQSTIVSSFSGCNLDSPWTASGSSYSNTKNGVHYTITLNVSESNTTGLVFAAIPNYGNNNGGYNNDGSIPGYVTGWTAVDYSDNGAGEYWEFVNLSYKQFSESQSNLVLTATGDLTWNDNSTGLTVIADALVGVSGGLDRITKGTKSVVIEADGRLTLGDGASMLGRVNDDDVVLWANDTAEYVALWHGGQLDLTSNDYGPVSSISIGNTQNDDLYRGVNNGGNVNADWNDGPQVNIDLGEKNWHFDGTTGDLTLPQESFKGSFTTISSNDTYNFWFNSSVTGPDGTVYAVGGEGNQSEKWVVAQGKDSTIWKKNLSNQDFGDGAGYNYPWILNIKYSTEHNLLYAGFNTGDSTGVISINPGNGSIDNSWIVRLSTDDSANVSQNSFTVDANGVPIIVGRSYGGYISHNNLTGTQGTDNAGNTYVQVDRTAIGELTNTFRWNGNDFRLDLDGNGTWSSPSALDTYFNVPVSYVGTPGTGGLQTATEGTEYSVGAITGYDGYGIDVDASMWSDQTKLGDFLAKVSGDHFTVVIGNLTPGVDQTVFEFSSVSDWSVPTGTVYHMDGNWTLVSGTGTVTTSTDILTVTYGTVKTYNVSSGTYSDGTRHWYNVEPNQAGTGYQSGDILRIPGSLLGGQDSTTVHSAIPLVYRDGSYGAYRMFIDMDAYPELSDVVVNMTVNVDGTPGYTGYVTAVNSDTGSRRWIFTVTTDLGPWSPPDQGLTVSFVTGEDLVFVLDAYGYAGSQTGIPSATSYRIVMNLQFTGNTTTYTAAGNGGGFGAWKVTDDTLGNSYLMLLAPGTSSDVTSVLAVGDTITFDFSGTDHTTTIASELAVVPNNPYISTYPDSLGYRLTDNFGISGQPDYNVGHIVKPNGTYNIKRVEGQQAFIWSQNWAHTYGSLGNGETFYDAAYDPVNDTVYATGYFGENNNNSNCLILALNNTNGTVKWQKFIGDNNVSNYGYSSSIGVGPTGDVVAIGKNDNGNAMITKLNGGDGTIIWQTVQTNHSNWNNQPTGAVDTNGDVYFGGSYYNNNVGRYNAQLTKLNGSNGTVAWSRNIGTTDNRDIYDQFDSFQQCINVGGGQVQWGSYVYDQWNDYLDAIAISIPQDGTGTDTYGRWVYSVDYNFNSIVGNDAWVVDPHTLFAPTDALTGELTQPGMNWNDQYIIYPVARINISSGLPGVVFADGSEITQAGITRAFKDTGDNFTLLNFEHNGKFIYFSGNINGNGYSTIRIPQNYDRALPIGYTVTLVLDEFDGYNVYVNTGNDTDNGLHIGAVGFDQYYTNNNYWRIGDDANTGIYTIMKVDTNRWILSGPSIADDY